MQLFSWLKIAFILTLKTALCIVLLMPVPETPERTASRDRFTVISAHQQMTVGLIQRANHFFYINEQATGLEYDLLKRIGSYIDVDVVVREFTTVNQLYSALHTGAIDLAMDMSEQRPVQDDFVQSDPYLRSQLYLVRLSTQPAQQKDTLVTVLMPEKYTSLLETVQHSQATWLTTHDNYDGIFAELAARRADMTIIDTFDLSLYRLLYPTVRTTKTLPQELDYVFLMPKDGSARLRAFLNSTISSLQASQFLRTLYRRYYAYNQISNRHNADAFLTEVRDTLPSLQPYFEQAGKQFGFDANLLAAIAYQESKWRSDAVSPTGVRGIMMLTNAAAKEVGVTDRTDIEQGIFGGAHYLRKTLAKIPKRILLPDRIWFALASYNIGFGHLEDARKLTQQAGFDPDVWDYVARFLPRLSNPNWHKYTRFGYARGEEPVTYVRNIRRFYDVLRHIEDPKPEFKAASLTIVPPETQSQSGTVVSNSQP